MKNVTQLYATCLLPVAVFAGFFHTVATAQGAVQELPPAKTIVLKEGAEVKLKFAEAVSSKTAAPDDPIVVFLDDDLRVGDVIVAKAGAKAFAVVSNARKAGMMGKAGELNIRLESLQASDGKVRLRGSKGREGESKVGTAVALTVLFGPVGLIKHGKNIEIPPGTPFLAYVADDTPLPSAGH